MKSLLTREQFRLGVFKRDGGRCVVPHCPKKMDGPEDKRFDAHHIYERRLWDARDEEGGYFLANGVTVCDDPHHLLAEKNVIPPQAFHRWLGIANWPLPKRLESRGVARESLPFGGTPVPRSDVPVEVRLIDFNKWGEPFRMPTREGGDIKYPSSLYLPFSPGRKDGHDDTMASIDHLVGVPLVVTEKMDGSNVKLVGGAEGYVASRAGHDASAGHPSFDMLKARFEQDWRWRIPEGLAVFGEWLYAKHSIHYTGDRAVPSYLMVFGAYDPAYRLFLGWSEVQGVAAAMGVPTVPVLANVESFSRWQLEADLHEYAADVIGRGGEGIVVRSVHPYHYGQHQTWLAKYVREGHVQTGDHWTQGKIVRNEVRQA